MKNAPDFDTIIIGSGFGGSVMAYRLAEAGQRVCVLERGKLYPPHSFPRSPAAMRANFWDPSEGLQGLYDVWSFRDVGAVVSAGVGGGSLIYANVLLRKDEGSFVKEDLDKGGVEHWPVTRAELEPHYDRVEKVLQPQRYPLEHAPYSSTLKTLAFKEAAKKKGMEWFLPPLAVTFANPNEPPMLGEPIKEELPNLHNRTRLTCTLCGECDVGCNTGSKNTLDYTYVSRAVRCGADLRPRVEVRSFEPHDGGYLVEYVTHSDATLGVKGASKQLPLQRLTCTRLVLAAGTLGSTYLLLKNRDKFPKISATALGSKFSGNGDLLTLAWRSVLANGAPRPLEASRGPVITSTVRMPGKEDGGQGRGYYVQEAGFPELVSWAVQLADAPTKPTRWLKFVCQWLALRLGWSENTEVAAELSALLGDCAPSVNTLPFLGMGHDTPDGKMSVNPEGYLEVSWRLNKQKELFRRMRQGMAELAEGMGAEFKDALTLKLHRVITVHPLGGCPMHQDSRHGVVDALGEVHNYPGLFVADGSVMPGAVGPNPSLTIAALADRFADRIVGA